MLILLLDSNLGGLQCHNFYTEFHWSRQIGLKFIEGTETHAGKLKLRSYWPKRAGRWRC
jgi:hypothetical protein